VARRPKKLSEIEKKFLVSLTKNGHKSDAKIAREIGVGKSTTNRIRKKLEREEILLDYIPIVDLEKIGISVYLVLLFEWKAYKDKERTSELMSDLENDPHVIFLGSGEGSEGLTTTVFFGFRTVEEYNKYFKNFRRKYEDGLGNMINLMIPVSEVVKHDFTDVIRHMLKTKERCVE